MDHDNTYNTRSKSNKNSFEHNGSKHIKSTKPKTKHNVVIINHERSSNKYKVVDTLPKKNVVIKKKEEEDVFKMKLNLDQKGSKNSEIILLLNQLAGVANRVKRLKEKRKKDSKDDSDDDSDEDFIDEMESIDGLNEEVIYTEDETRYIKSLNKTKRKQFIEMENTIIDLSREEIPIRFKILDSDMDLRNKSAIIRKIDHFYQLDPSDNEYQKLYPWVEQLDKIPFGKYCPTKVSLNNSPQAIQQYLIDTKKAMDNAVYGHDVAKTQMLNIVARDISNPHSGGNCIAIEGPMGNGKTTLIKEGICKAMNRPFAFIALGGMQDASFLQGHEYTYEGSKCGRIVEMLTETGCMNPVIFFDELDKVSDTPKGEEITNLLCHLTDSSQNKEFHDKYFSGINFDLSRATFIFSYNNASAINPILLDRMYKIKTKGFDKKSKTKIANNYLLPKILKDFNFSDGDVTFKEEAIHKLIESHSNKEEGVRNLKRNIETIIFKLNIMRYLKPELVSLSTELEKAEIESTNKPVAKVQVETSSEPEVKEEIEAQDETSGKLEDKKEVEAKDETSSKLEDKKEVEAKDETACKSEESEIKLVIDDMVKSTIPEEIKVDIPDDIVNFDIKNFKIPYCVTDEDISFFLKNEPVNVSIEHLYM